MTTGLWCAVVVLVVVGVAASIGRGVFPGDFATRADPVRGQILAALHRADPFASERAQELDRFDVRYAANPLLTLAHVVPGGVFLILAPLQFSARIRNRHIRFHRWSGRVLVATALVAAAAGLHFGLSMPYGGSGEAAAIAVFGGLFVIAVLRAFVAIRQRQVAVHREWMIRAFAIAIGIATVRVVAAVLDLALTPAGVGPSKIFVLSLWIGWGATLAAAEIWIQHTRPATRSVLEEIASSSGSGNRAAE
ncbi:MAG TPA: DUF2306 domain-containing protein [Thermoanaerobaculia bacterium]|nr:DUF2306 domain-containing protein [Thermoanaerobaculia bacterium]